MTQILKLKGIIEKPGNRPILTAAGKSPLLMLDARRYNFQNGSKVSDIQAIGGLKDSLSLTKLTNAEYGAIFNSGEVPHFSFNNVSGLKFGGFPIITQAITFVIVYKIDSLPDNDLANRIYASGLTVENRCIFSARTYGVDIFTGFDTKRSPSERPDGWCVGVHTFNGANSSIVMSDGSLEKFELNENEGVSSLSLWGNSDTPTNLNGNIAYIAMYEGSFTDKTMLDLFYEARNNFGLM